LSAAVLAIVENCTRKTVWQHKCRFGGRLNVIVKESFGMARQWWCRRYRTCDLTIALRGGSVAADAPGESFFSSTVATGRVIVMIED
jgi:hypothetical protein